MKLVLVYPQRPPIEGANHMSLIVDEDAAGTTGAILNVVSLVGSVRPLVG